MTNHLRFAFYPIATPTLRTLMINSKVRSSRIIPESALKWAVHPTSSLVGLPKPAFPQLVILPNTIITMRTSTIQTHKRVSISRLNATEMSM